ncbi:MAG TPA: trypsin-like serine protease [Bacteroidetes bacterium]|nr:trypsin-like serine protease [Bacteroidota bacterium]
MKEVIENYKNVVIQIATPYSTGTGFYLKEAGYVVTNEHVVRGNREVVIDGNLFKRQMATVLFTDPRIDLALLECPKGGALPAVQLANGKEISEGEQVMAIGHPFGLKFTATKGIVSNADHKENDIRYIQHDAALNPGNSGGPLISMDGAVVGMNTFIIHDGDNIGFSLPAAYLEETLNDYKKESAGQIGSRCINCQDLIFENIVEEDGFCPNCGSKIRLPNQEEEYEAAGIAQTIENILEECGHEIKLARRGPNLWEVIQGSAKIYVTYYEPNGLIAGDAILCDLPKKGIKKVYEYLLRQNGKIEGLTLSVKGKEIVLSLIIFDRYLNMQTGLELFQRLFHKADEFDNILVEEYGCRWKEEL